VDAIDNVLLNSKMHYLGMAARNSEPILKLSLIHI